MMFSMSVLVTSVFVVTVLAPSRCMGITDTDVMVITNVICQRKWYNTLISVLSIKDL